PVQHAASPAADHLRRRRPRRHRPARAARREGRPLMAGPVLGPMRFEPLGRAALDTCVGVLGEILARERELTAVRHPLGFLCLPIVRDPGWGVCIHVWTDRFPSVRPTTTGKHAHSWDLESLVLYGALGNAVFELTPDDTAGGYQIAEIISTSG